MRRMDVVKNSVRIIFVVIMFIGLFIILNKIDEYRYVTGVVVDVEDNDCITMVDRTGERWQFFADDLDIGNIITVTLNTQHTEEIEDDEIIGVKIN